MNSTSQNLSLRGLRTFSIAAEQMSFRSAADKLFVTASAVSHQIRNLEEELGIKLFDRNGRTLTLTAAGKSLYQDIKPLIADLDAVTSRHRESRVRSTLSISVQPFFASELFVPRLPEFRKLHPDIEIMIDTSDEAPEKHPGAADVSIRVFRSPPDGLLAERLFALRLVPAATPDFRDRLQLRGNSITSSFPLIVHSTRPKAWQQWQRAAGITLPGTAAVLRLDSMIAVARAAEQGLGAALVPVQLSDSWFRSGSIVPLFEHELETSDAYFSVCRPDDAENDNVRALRHWVLQEFGDAA